MLAIDRFAAAAGVATAGLLAPLAVVAVAAQAPLHWSFWLVVLVGSGFVGGFVGARATVTPRTAERFRGGWRVVGPFALPPVLLAAGLAVELATTLPSAAVWAPVVAGAVLTTTGGLLLATEARSLYGTRLTNESETYVELPAEASDAQRRRQRVVGVVLALVVAGLGVGTWVRTGDVSPLFIVALGPLALVFDAGQERAAVDAGLKQGSGVEPWAAFDRFRVRDHEIVVERAAWYRTAVRIDRSRLDDEAALVDLLSAKLPEVA